MIYLFAGVALRRYVVEVAEELERIKKPINELIEAMKEEESAKVGTTKVRNCKYVAELWV